MAPVAGSLWRNLRCFQVFGANTDVGKTIISTILCRAVTERNPTDKIWYLKPVSTGALDDADVKHLERHAPKVRTQNLYQFNDPVSPHLAVRLNNISVSDATLLRKIADGIAVNAEQGSGFMLVETAGGSTSPGPSGSLQADLYRPLRLPAIFIADSRLGGISTSISSFESLHTRGYDVEGVAVFKDSYYKNYEYFQSYFADHKIPVLAIEPPPERSAENDVQAMNAYYDGVSSDGRDQRITPLDLVTHLNDRHAARIVRLESMSAEAFDKIWWPFTQHKHITPENITTIDSAYGDYFQTINPSIRFSSTSPSPIPEPMLKPTLDASASWWTQGVGHANPRLTMAAAYAAGRYGHVMFAEAIHEPALSLATELTALTANSRLQRTFYSDNGSTGMEVAVKMALKASAVQYGWEDTGQQAEIIGLQGSYHGDTIGAMDMSEPSVYNEKIPWYKGRGFWFEAPSVRMQEGKWVVSKPESYQGRLGKETVLESLQQVFDRSRDDSGDAFKYEMYLREKIDQLTQSEKRRFGALVMEPVVLGAGGMLLVDPLFQRTLVNVIRSSSSLFSTSYDSFPPTPGSHSWTGLPVIHDEVFTGLYRLGHATSSSLLGVHPDISVHAKLLTGGLLPLCATLASESIFEAFLADDKANALLHGHSYTAHPIGCAVALESLKLLQDFEVKGDWNAFKEDWGVASAASAPTPSAPATKTANPVMTSIAQKINDMASALQFSSPATTSATTPSPQALIDPDILPDGRRSRHALPSSPKLWSMWSLAFITRLSHATSRVEGVWALGSVLAITLRDAQGGGYTSNAARGAQRALLEGKEGEAWNVHARVLGNVLYLMASQTSSAEDVRMWEGRVVEVLKV